MKFDDVDDITAIVVVSQSLRLIQVKTHNTETAGQRGALVCSSQPALPQLPVSIENR